MKFFVLVALVLGISVASADTSTVHWVGPTGTCAGGEPIAQCATTGFKIYGALSGQPKVLLATPLATSTVQVFSNVAAGNWCYELTTMAGTVESAHSAPQACGVATPPPIPVPKPPTVTVDTVAYELNPAPGGTALVAARAVGMVPLGTPCLDIYRLVAGVKYNQLPGPVVDLVNFPTLTMSYRVWAKCGPSST